VKYPSYQISIGQLNQLLKTIGLLKARYDKKGIFSADFIEQSRKGNYIDIYKTAIRNFDYDILLFDDSIMQFSYNNPDGNKIIRYAYYQFPFAIPSYKEYLETNGLYVEDAGDLFLDAYEQEVAEALINSGALAIRYDFSLREYRPSVHPASHFHVGLDNHLRLPISYYITPMMFGIFILKQAYYDRWTSFMSNPSFRKHFESCKKQCKKLEKICFDDSDKKELYFY
jgi:hypothetical protein